MELDYLGTEQTFTIHWLNGFFPSYFTVLYLRFLTEKRKY